MASWKDIKELAADFQRTQLTSAALKLSERNCIEIVQKLNELKLLDIIYTNDGKEYLTPKELEKEIREELIVKEGRINLVELQQLLSVDFTLVENKVQELVNSDKDYYLVLGQLINQSYVDLLCEEMNDKLQEKGLITVVEITKLYDLPRDFLLPRIEKHLGTSIDGKLDEKKDIVYTQAYISQHKSRIFGAFGAATKPVNIHNTLQNHELNEKLSITLLEEMVKDKTLLGSISAGRPDVMEYIPKKYESSQNEWVRNFFSQNFYIEYDALRRLGINEEKGYLKKMLEGETIHFLVTCCVGESVKENVEAQIDESLASVGWIDVTPVLPSVLSNLDCQQLLQKIVRTKKDVALYSDHIIATNTFLESCKTPFEKLMYNKARKAVTSKSDMLSFSTQEALPEQKKDNKEQKDAKPEKEGKNKSTKNKYFKGRKQQNEGGSTETSQKSAKSKKESTALLFLSEDEISKHLYEVKDLKECPEDFIEEIAKQLVRPLQKRYVEVVKSVFLESVGGGGSGNRKKIHSELSEKIIGLWNNAKLFEKAIKIFPDEASQLPLNKYLLKTICTDITNAVFSAFAAEYMMAVSDEGSLTQESRSKILLNVKDLEERELLNKLNKSLVSKELEEFFTAVESICSSNVIDIVLKKTDKKKERQLIFNHKMALAEQLKAEDDPALALHLALTLLFSVFTQCIVHAPGRCVPSILLVIKPHLDEEAFNTLSNYQDLVMQQMKLNADVNLKEVSELKELLPSVKDVALTSRKSATTSTNE